MGSLDKRSALRLLASSSPNSQLRGEVAFEFAVFISTVEFFSVFMASQPRTVNKPWDSGSHAGDPAFVPSNSLKMDDVLKAQLATCPR